MPAAKGSARTPLGSILVTDLTTEFVPVSGAHSCLANLSNIGVVGSQKRKENPMIIFIENINGEIYV